MLDHPKELPPILPPQPPTRTNAITQTTTESQNLTIKTENPKIEAKKSLTLPTIEIPKSQEIIISPNPQKYESIRYKEEESSNFDETIRNIHLDILGSNKSKEEHHLTKELEKKDYYSPKNLGEGYFSEIKHYLKNKDAKEIVDDIIKKDFLTGMKDYHDQKSQGKPFFIHMNELKEKLEKRMEELMQKEESWHHLKTELEEAEQKKKHLEAEIDQEAQELKELFKLVKMNQYLEKEAKPGEEFTLRSGQKLKTLNDLRKALNYMRDDEFNHHVTHDRNDFANWTEHALGLHDLKSTILKARSREELMHILKKLV